MIYIKYLFPYLFPKHGKCWPIFGSVGPATHEPWTEPLGCDPTGEYEHTKAGPDVQISNSV